MQLIQVTMFRDNPVPEVKVLLNPEQFSSVEPQNEHSRILMANHSEFRVRETLDEIAALSGVSVAVLVETSEEDEPEEDEPEEDEPAEVDPYGLDDMTKAQLVDFADEHEIEIDPAKTKAEIIETIRSRMKELAGE